MNDIILTVQYKDKIVAGQYIPSNQTSDIPNIKYNGDLDKLYTIIMYDPDAKNKDYIHFIDINIPKGNITNGQIILSYKQPTPPPKSGIHRYIFLLFEQNGIIAYQKINDRDISLDKIKSIFNLENLKSSVFFTSKNMVGGKKTRSKKKNNKKSRKVSFFFV
jgi:phosphatidylethanolamine-binding protein (PEBP) family uncharacterized protein